MEAPSLFILFVQLLFAAGGIFCFYLIYRFAVAKDFSLGAKFAIAAGLLLFGSIFMLLGGGFIYSDWFREEAPIPNKEFAARIFGRLNKNGDAQLDRRTEYDYKDGKYSRYWGSELAGADIDSDSLVSLPEWESYISQHLDKNGDGVLNQKAAGWKLFLDKAAPKETIEH